MASATAGLVTLEEFARLRDDDRTYELSEGELVEMTFPTAGHSLIAKRIAKALEDSETSADEGEAFVEAGFLLQENPPILRRPDVAWISKKHLAKTSLGDWFRGAPLIAVEVVSPSETASDLNRKVRQYLAYGSSVVLVVYPQPREIHVYRQGSSIAVLTADDRVRLPELPGGWERSVGDLIP